MTHSGGKPHRVGYEGQEFKLTVFDSDKGKRIIIGWSTKPFDEKSQRAVETPPGWNDARSETVADRITGDQE